MAYSILAQFTINAASQEEAANILELLKKQEQVIEQRPRPDRNSSEG